MINLIQQESYLIGDEKAIQELAEKKARILILSDSHGNYAVLRKIILQFGPDCDALVFCGDGASDIAMLLNESRGNQELLNAIPPVMAIVRGNNDPSSYPLDFDIRTLDSGLRVQNLYLPMTQILTVNNHRIFIAHGHKFSVYYNCSLLDFEALENQSTVALFGHTHIPYEANEKWSKVINPGSVSLPRGGCPPSFAILTVEDNFTDTAFLKIINPYSNNTEYKIFWV